jgi:hypothetical protein
MVIFFLFSADRVGFVQLYFEIRLQIAIERNEKRNENKKNQNISIQTNEQKQNQQNENTATNEKYEQIIKQMKQFSFLFDKILLTLFQNYLCEQNTINIDENTDTMNIDTSINTNSVHSASISTSHLVTTEIIEKIHSRIERPDLTSEWEKNSFFIFDGKMSMEILINGFQCIPPEIIDQQEEKKQKVKKKNI